MDAAVAVADLQDVLRHLPKGLDTMCGERGVRLATAFGERPHPRPRLRLRPCLRSECSGLRSLRRLQSRGALVGAHRMLVHCRELASGQQLSNRGLTLMMRPFRTGPPLWRAEAARGDRPGAHQEPVPAPPGRSDVGAGCRKRAPCAGACGGSPSAAQTFKEAHERAGAAGATSEARRVSLAPQPARRSPALPQLPHHTQLVFTLARLIDRSSSRAMFCRLCQDALEAHVAQRSPKCGMITVAHRLSTVWNAEVIVVLHKVRTGFGRWGSGRGRAARLCASSRGAMRAQLRMCACVHAPATSHLASCPPLRHRPCNRRGPCRSLERTTNSSRRKGGFTRASSPTSSLQRAWNRWRSEETGRQIIQGAASCLMVPPLPACSRRGCCLSSEARAALVPLTLAGEQRGLPLGRALLEELLWQWCRQQQQQQPRSSHCCDAATA